jgi:hypothetical protein
MRLDPTGSSRPTRIALSKALSRFPGNPVIEFGRGRTNSPKVNRRPPPAGFEYLLALNLDAIVATGSAYDERIFREWT